MDCFGNETLTQAVKALAYDKGVELLITTDELNIHRNNNKASISKYQDKIFWEGTGGELSKLELGLNQNSQNLTVKSI